MTPRQTDKRDRLIQTAVTLMYQQGFHHTTLADIAREASVPLGTVYYFFKTKEAIGEALVELLPPELSTGCAQQWDGNPHPTARLGRLIQNMLGDGQRLSRGGCPIGTLCSELHKQGGGPLAPPGHRDLQRAPGLAGGAVPGDLARGRIHVTSPCICSQPWRGRPS